MAHPKNDVMFVADAMLGSVARKLRIFGFDTLYVAHADDTAILEIAIKQSRVILTSDKEFFKRIVKSSARGVLVDSGSELDTLVHILSKNGISRINVDGIGSRCAVCNSPLEVRSPAQVKQDIPEKVIESHREFFQCVECGKVYWNGSHLSRIRVLARRIESKLNHVETAI